MHIWLCYIHIKQGGVQLAWFPNPQDKEPECVLYLGIQERERRGKRKLVSIWLRNGREIKTYFPFSLWIHQPRCTQSQKRAGLFSHPVRKSGGYEFRARNWSRSSSCAHGLGHLLKPSQIHQVWLLYEFAWWFAWMIFQAQQPFEVIFILGKNLGQSWASLKFFGQNSSRHFTLNVHTYVPPMRFPKSSRNASLCLMR